MYKKLTILTLVLALAFTANCKKDEKDDSTPLLLLLVASASNKLACTITTGSDSVGYPSTTATTSSQSIAVNPNRAGAGSFGFVTAKGLTANKKIVFTDLGSGDVSVYKKSDCNVGVTETVALTSDISSLSATGTKTYTVVTASDYLFFFGSTSTSTPKVQIQ